MSDSPWNELEAPTSPNAISARRVDETGPWNFYWGRDSHRRCLLVLRFDAASIPKQPLPRLRGVEVSLAPVRAGESPHLVITLLDPALRDVFLRLCMDILASATNAGNEAEAVAVTVARTWRWHHLMRGGGTGLLSPEEQKGLIGELLILERYLLPAVPVPDALGAWRGPLGAAKDFVLGGVGIESKARSTALASTVPISSEHQLDLDDTPLLFLHLTVLDAVRHGSLEPGFTLTEVALRIRDRIREREGRADGSFLTLLTAAGFDFDHDYSGMRWSAGEAVVYRVTENFPRLVPDRIPGAISSVEYILSLAHCEPHRVPTDDLAAMLQGSSDVN